MSTAIRFLSRKEIDVSRWDKCIEAAENGLIYAYSFYLDALCTNWGGLVLNDYEAVMPLPCRKKYGIAYIYFPPFIAQLGLFGNNLTAGMLEAFLKAIPRHFKYWDFPLNHKNLFVLTQFPLQQRINYVLDLKKSYEVIYFGYRDNIKRNIRKAISYGCYTAKDIDIASVISLAKEQVLQTGASVQDLNRFQELYKQLHQRQKATTYGVYTAQDELVASCVFTFSHHRAYYILVGNHPNGRTLGASHQLIDAFIKDHANKDMLLDFEGSDLRNLAFFYSSFGAVEEKYAAIQLNRLPWWIKWLKR